MTTEHSNGSELDPNPIVAETPAPNPIVAETPAPNPTVAETPAPKVEQLGTVDGETSIEECVEKITLVSDPPSVEGNDHKDDSKSESESESESSESETSASSSSSSSSSDSDDEEEEAPNAVDREVEEGEMSGSDDEKMVSWSAVDQDIDDDDVVGGPIRSKNEIQDLPPVSPIDVTIGPNHQMLPVGVIMSVMGAQVIVEGAEKHDPLNEGSIIWLTESRKPLGLVDEIFGPVKNPYYVVRYNSENEVPVGIHGGTLVSFVPEFADHVLNNNKELYKKGYDASGMNDEELSDEYEFSDDEKEAEFRKMQKMAKRGVNDQNPRNKKNNKKKFSPKDQPATPFVDHGNFSPFSGIGQGQLGGATTVSPLPPSNASPNFATHGVWTNGNTLPQHPQPALFPNGFPTNGISCYPHNTQFPHQMPMPVIPFQQQMHPSQHQIHPSQQQMHPSQQQMHPSQQQMHFPNMPPGVQPNIFAHGLVGQNQMTLGPNQMAFGLGSPYQQMQQLPFFPAQQGFPPTELQSERNLNFHSSSISGSPSQFRPGSSPSRGRKPFHGADRKGWRPAK